MVKCDVLYFCLKSKKKTTCFFLFVFLYRCDCFSIYTEERPCQTGSVQVVISFFHGKNVWRLELKGRPWSRRDAFNATELKFCSCSFLRSHVHICNVVVFSSAVSRGKVSTRLSLLHLLSFAASAVRCAQHKCVFGIWQSFKSFFIFKRHPQLSAICHKPETREFKCLFFPLVKKVIVNQLEVESFVGWLNICYSLGRRSTVFYFGLYSSVFIASLQLLSEICIFKTVSSASCVTYDTLICQLKTYFFLFFCFVSFSVSYDFSFPCRFVSVM